MPTLIENVYKMKEALLQRHTNAIKDKYYLPLTGKMSTQQPSVDLKLIISQFLTNQTRILLLQGSAGAGKTMFCHQLTAQLLESKEQDNIIPLYIALKPEYRNNNNLITFILKERGFSAEQIVELKSKYRFLFILDGYDQLGSFQNLYVTYQLDQWQAKVIVTYRPEYFINTKDHRSCFIPYQNQKSRSHLFKEVNIAPLTDEQIELYLKHHSVVAIFQYFSAQLSFLKTLVKNPLFLKIIVDTISKLSSREIKDEKQVNKNLHSEVLHTILDSWFSYHEDKLKNNGLWDKNDKTLKQQMLDFSIALAQEMQKQNTIRIVYKPVSKLFPAKQDIWSKFFDHINPKIKLLCTTRPLLKTGIDQYSFIHADLIDYLATQKSLNEVSANDIQEQKIQADNTASMLVSSTKISSHLLNHRLNQKLFTQDSGRIQFLADRVWERSTFKNELFALVFASKQTEQMAVGAANAITILNMAKVPFCALNLSRIKISGAVLDNSLLDNADLSYADIRNVSFRNAFLRNVIFDNANMKYVDFGELPRIDAHKDKIDSFVMSSDGSLLASLGKARYAFEGVIITSTINFSTHQLFPSEQATSIAFLPNTTILIVSYIDGTLGIYDINTEKLTEKEHGTITEKIKTELKNIFCIAASPIQDQLAVIGRKLDDHTLLQLFDLNSKSFSDELCVDFGLKKNQVFLDRFKLSYSLDGSRLVAWYAESTIILLIDTHVCQMIKRIVHPKLNSVAGLAFSEDSQQLLISSEQLIFVFNCKDGELHYYTNCAVKIDYHTNPLIVLSNFANSSFHEMIIALCDVNGNIHLLDINNNDIIQSYPGYKMLLTHMLVLRHKEYGKVLCLAGEDGCIRFLTLRNLQNKMLHLESHQSEIVKVILINNDQKIISAGADGTLKVWDARYGRYEKTLPSHTLDINDLAVSPDGKLFASASADGTVQIFDAITLNKMREIRASSKAVNCVVFSIDSNFLITSAIGVSYFWELATGKLLTDLQDKEQKQNNNICSMTLSPDGEYLFSGDSRGFIARWSIKNKKLMDRKRYDEYNKCISSITFSPNGQYFVAGSYSNNIIFCTHTGELIKILDCHFGEISRVRFSPDSKWLATSSHDGVIYLWGLKKLNVEHIIKSDGSAISDFYFSVNSEKMIAVYWNQSIKLWMLKNNKVLLNWSLNHKLTAINTFYNNTQGLSFANKIFLKQLADYEGGLSYWRNLLVKSNNTDDKLEKLNYLMNATNVLVLDHSKGTRTTIINWLLKKPEILFCRHYSQTFPPDAFDDMREYYQSPELRFFHRGSNNWDLIQNIGRDVNSNQFTKLSLQHGADINKPNKENTTALNIAISNGNLYSVRYMVKHGADITTFSDGETRIVLATRLGYLEIVKFLHQCGMDLRYQNAEQPPAIYFAVKYGHLNIIKYFESQGIDIHTIYYDGRIINLFAIAAANGYFDIVDYYIQTHKALIDAKLLTTAFAASLREKHVDVASFLFKQEVEIEPSKRAAAIYFAIKNGALEVVRGLYARYPELFNSDTKLFELISEVLRGTDNELYEPAAIKYLLTLVRNPAYQSSDNNETFLMLAVRTRQLQLVQQITHPDNVNLRTRDGVTALMYSVKFKQIAVSTYLLDHKADIEARDFSYGDTALTLSAQENNLPLVELLSRRGANINHQDNNGFSPLILAAQNGRLAIVNYLLKHGAKTNLATKKAGTTALTTASGRGHLLVVKALLLHGADPNQADHAGCNILHYAAQAGNLVLIEYLVNNLKKNALDVCTKKGHTPIMLAALFDHQSVFELLHKAGAKLDIIDNEGHDLYYCIFAKMSRQVAIYLFKNNLAKNALKEIADQFLRLLKDVIHLADNSKILMIRMCAWTYDLLCEYDATNSQLIPSLQLLRDIYILLDLKNEASKVTKNIQRLMANMDSKFNDAKRFEEETQNAIAASVNQSAHSENDEEELQKAIRLSLG